MLEKGDATPTRIRLRSLHPRPSPALGSGRTSSAPMWSLHTHIQDVVAVVEYEGLREVVLVDHGYSKQEIAGVAESGLTAQPADVP